MEDRLRHRAPPVKVVGCRLSAINVRLSSFPHPEKDRELRERYPSSVQCADDLVRNRPGDAAAGAAVLDDHRYRVRRLSIAIGPTRPTNHAWERPVRIESTLAVAGGIDGQSGACAVPVLAQTVTPSTFMMRSGASEASYS
jgi:hypothetical protein